MADEQTRQVVEHHRDTLEKIAGLDVDLQLVDGAAALLAEVDG